VPEIPGQIRIKRGGKTSHLFINGEEFPWAIARGSVHVRVDPDGTPRVTLTLLADRVIVDDDYGVRVAGDRMAEWAEATQAEYEAEIASSSSAEVEAMQARDEDRGE